MSDAPAIVDAIQEANHTQLGRLGSSKSLYAATGGTIDTDPVLRATADAEHAAWQTFRSWADDERNDAARTYFEDLAATERDHLAVVTDRLGADPYEPTTLPRLHAYLRELDHTLDRIGGLLGRILASRQSKQQTVGYFIGNAAEDEAELFRSFGEDLDAQLDGACDLFNTLCVHEADRTRVEEAAAGAIGAAYEEYVENLEALGANPKPIC